MGEASRAAFHWHLEIIPRLTPVSGLAWDGGVAINPVPPEEAAQVLRAHACVRASEWRRLRRDRGLPRLRRFATLSALHVVGGNNSVVECDLAKVEVAGSNPVSRSIRLTWRFARRTARFAHGRPVRENALSERSESKGSLARAFA